MDKYKLLVTSVADPVCARQPQTQAVEALINHWGFDYRPMVDASWIGFVSKLRGFFNIVRELVEGGEYTHIMFIDARDIVLLGGPDEVMERWFKFNHLWVYATEPVIWTPDSFTPEEYPTPQCDYRYFNAGASLGEVHHIYKYFNLWSDNYENLPLSMPLGDGGDQDWLSDKIIRDHYPDAAILDHECSLFQCMCHSLVPPDPRCTMMPGKVVNHVTGTEPLVIHFNGGDDITQPSRRILWQHLI